MAGGKRKSSLYYTGAVGIAHGFFIKSSQMTLDSLQTFPASSAIIMATVPKGMAA